MGMSKAPSAFLKWAGGKQALAPLIVSAFPGGFGRYIEPFLGGGSVFFAARPPVACLSDANGWLVDTYLAIRDDWMAVARILDTLPNTKEDFLRIRAINPCTLPPADRAAHLIYLNKTCFRGLFRVNRHGQFNSPYGAYSRRYYDADVLSAVSKALAGVEISCSRFDSALENARRGDFVYLDPPYVKLGGYSDFNRYTRDQFRESDQRRLAEACADLTRRGAKWLLSNSDTALVKELYAGNSFMPISARREINLRSKSRDVRELLIANYELDTAPLDLFSLSSEGSEEAVAGRDR